MKRAPVLVVCGVALFGRSSGAAESAPRVALLDALVLTPALEKVNTRAAAAHAVTTGLRQQGWEAIESPSSCRDIGCAQTVAAAARASYVMILVGRFVPGESYATDLGVSLWRDGAVVAERRETDEISDAESGSRADSVLRCGPPAGACTAQLLVSKLQRYAEKLGADELATIHRQEISVLGPGFGRSVPRPAIGGTAESAGGRGNGRVWGWSLLGTGVGLGGGAALLWAFNNSGTDCHTVIGDGDGCRQERRTGTAALAVGAAALASIGAGIVVLMLDRDRTRLALSMHPSGMGLEGRF